MGKKLKQLARTKQVLCITHLPQIASFADQHYLIEKRESGGRTKTSIRPLDAEERTREIARMISGAKLTGYLAEARRADAEGESVRQSRFIGLELVDQLLTCYLIAPSFPASLRNSPICPL